MAIENGIIINTDLTQDLLKRVKDLSQNQVLVGIPSSTATRTDGVSNASLGYIHEYGSPAKNIPARPFLIPAINSVRDKAVAMLKKAAALNMEKKGGEARNVLEALGQVGVAAVKNQIINGSYTPLAPATIADRQARGRTSVKPLIDSAQMLNSITYIIRKKS